MGDRRGHSFDEGPAEPLVALIHQAAMHEAWACAEGSGDQAGVTGKLLSLREADDLGNFVPNQDGEKNADAR